MSNGTPPSSRCRTSASVYRGPRAFARFWRDWLAAWETRPVRAIELVDAGDRVVALIDQRMRGRSTGIEVPFGKYAQVYTFTGRQLIVALRRAT